MNSVTFGANPASFKTLKQVAKTSCGKHLEFNENSALFRERGITDIWCNTHPKTGDPMLYLEDEKGNLIRDFNLKNQLEQVRYYFNKANARKNEIIRLKRQLEEIDKKYNPINKIISKNIEYKCIDIDTTEYIVNGKRYTDYDEAFSEALKDFPEFEETVKEGNKIRQELARELFTKEAKYENLLP